MKYVKTFELFRVSDSFYLEDFEGLVELVNDVASKLGEEAISELGCGTFGCAYELKSGRVLKLTTDKSEAISTSRIKKRSDKKHLVSIYDVRKVDTFVYIGSDQQDVFAIVQELIYTLNMKEQVAFSMFLTDFYDDEISDKEFTKSVYEKASQQEIDLFWNKLLPQRESILSDIEKSGVFAYEAHPQNVGFDKYGTFKIFDPLMAEVGSLKNRFNKTISV